VKDAEGLGVLTGWAAGKFTGDQVGAMVKKSGIESKVKNKKIVIPGRVARIKGSWRMLCLVGKSSSVRERRQGSEPSCLNM